MVDLAVEEVSRTDKSKSDGKKTTNNKLRQELIEKDSRNANLTLNEIFWYAVENNDLEVVQKLARNDAVALNLRTPKNERIIESLLRNNNFKMVQVLFVNGRQFTPENLFTAVQYKEVEVVKILVQSQPIINYLKDYRNTYDSFGKLPTYYDDIKQQELKRAELEKGNRFEGNGT